MKPLFIPLKTKHFEAFADGSKHTEYRIYGRRWNERTCQVRRPVVLSKGYGKRDRLHGYVEAFRTGDVPQAVVNDWIECYGDLVCVCAMIRIRLAQPTLSGRNSGVTAWAT